MSENVRVLFTYKEKNDGMERKKEKKWRIGESWIRSWRWRPFNVLARLSPMFAFSFMPLRHENYSPPPPSPVHAFTFSFILAIISTQFSLPLFPFFLSFFFTYALLKCWKLYSVRFRAVRNATVFVSETLFLINSPSRWNLLLTFQQFIESIRGIVSLFLSSHRHVTFTHFPRAQYVFISSLALTSLVREPLQSPSLSVLFTFIFHFLGSCFLFLSFFLQGDGTHFPSSTLDFSFFLFNSPSPLLLPPLPHFFHFHNSCRWKLRGRCNIKYAVYPCLESSIYIYIYFRTIQFLSSVQSSRVSFF